MSEVVTDETDHLGDTYFATVVPMMKETEEAEPEIFPLDGLDMKLYACYNGALHEVKDAVKAVDLATSEVEIEVAASDPSSMKREVEYRLKGIFNGRVETFAAWKVPRI